jgi:hypothetical protein
VSDAVSGIRFQQTGDKLRMLGNKKEARLDFLMDLLLLLIFTP